MWGVWGVWMGGWVMGLGGRMGVGVRVGLGLGGEVGDVG